MNEEERNDLEMKNSFVIAMRNYLAGRYQTGAHYTFEGGDFEYSYCGFVQNSRFRSPEKPKDLTGFAFRKELCSTNMTKDNSHFLDEVKKFFRQKEGLEARLEKETNSGLTFNLGDSQYILTTYVDVRYDGEMHVSISSVPDLSKMIAGASNSSGHND